MIFLPVHENPHPHTESDRMYVGPRASKSRTRLRLPPAAMGVIAVLAVCMAAVAQVNEPAANTQPAAATAAAPAIKPEQPSLWELHKKGGYVMWALDLCSVIALAIIFERFFSLRRSKVIPNGFMAGLKSVYRDPLEDRQKAVNYCQANDSAMSRMVLAFVRRLPRGFASAEKALEDAGGNEALRLRANLRFFYAIGSCATLLGLIGTIAGMIKAFMQTAAAGDAENKVQLLSEGIYEAMVCTFGGLAVALLVTAFYYFFIGRIEKLITEINDQLTDFSEEYGLAPETDDELSTTAALPRL